MNAYLLHTDIFLPADNLLVNLSKNKEQVEELLRQLPQAHSIGEKICTENTYSALGAALQAGLELAVSCRYCYSCRTLINSSWS